MNKQEIQNKLNQNRLDGIQAVDDIRCLESKISNLNREEEQLNKQLKECDELKLTSGYGFAYSEVTENQRNSLDVENGRCYPTKELAEIAMSNSNTRNKLEAYSRVIDPDWRECWDGNQYNFLVHKDNKWTEYLVWYSCVRKYLGTVYMSEKAAKRIARALNEKEITL